MYIYVCIFYKMHSIEYTVTNFQILFFNSISQLQNDYLAIDALRTFYF